MVGLGYTSGAITRAMDGSLSSISVISSSAVGVAVLVDNLIVSAARTPELVLAFRSGCLGGALQVARGVCVWPSGGVCPSVAEVLLC